MDRLKIACDNIFNLGWSEYKALETCLNEVYVSLGILENPSFRVETLFYEPKLDTDERTIDFVMIDQSESKWHVDVKTIMPDKIDRWNQYVEILDQGLLTPNNTILLDHIGLGGEIWHSRFASRARMLEYTLEFEDKLGRNNPNFDPTKSIMVFCGNGYDWTEDQLEDFVFFYQQGNHRRDDPLGVMEDHHIQKKKLILPRRIKRFAYLERGGLAYETTRINWNVSSGP